MGLIGGIGLIGAGCHASNEPSMLRVEQHQIVDAAGEPVVLRGVALADPYFLAEVEARDAAADLRALADRWAVNAIRVPIYPELWMHHPGYLARYVDPVVERAQALGLYVLLGWHAQGHPHEGMVEVPAWANEPPWRGNPTAPSEALAVAALTRIVQRYRDQPGVLYGTFNEPAGLSWSAWRPVAERLVDAVHAVDSTAVVLVSGTNWGYDLSGALEQPIRRDNVVYETHPYPGKGEDWIPVVRALTQRHPVLIGEWGFAWSGEGAEPPPSFAMEAYGAQLLQVARALEMGWLAWIWHDTWQPGLLRTFDGYVPSEYGKFVQNQLEASSPEPSR